MGSAAVVLLALLVDWLVGDPPAVYRRVPHPVALLGRGIERAEAWLAPRPERARTSSVKGVVLAAATLALAAALGWLIHVWVANLPAGAVIEALLASTLIACRDLHDRVRDVAERLRRRDLPRARRAVGHLVGRDPRLLDEPGVARAAMESLAENFSDAVVAPCFWFLVAGLPGLAAYKAVNTLDSMVGHRTTRYEHFGKPAARLDDVLNWLPARLSGALLCAGAVFSPEARAGRAWRIMVRDARRHRSVNAGWPEAAVAGALDVRLAGPRRYREGRVEDPWLGDGRAEAAWEDVHRALALYRSAACLLAVALAAAVVV